MKRKDKSNGQKKRGSRATKRLGKNPNPDSSKVYNSQKKSWLRKIKESWSHLQFGWKFLISFLGILSSLLALVPLAPRLSVSPGTPLDSGDVFSTPFSISNDGYFSIYDVKFGCGVGSVKTADGQSGIEGAQRFCRKI